MPKFRKKPVEIEAVEWTGANISEITAFLHGVGKLCFGDVIEIKTLEGMMRARIGDWIIKGVKGEFYPCKPDIFAATYDAVPTERERLRKLLDVCREAMRTTQRFHPDITDWRGVIAAIDHEIGAKELQTP